MYSIAAILIALALMIVALIYKLFPPKEINTLYGYHMKSSMRNTDTWREANHYAANFMVALSLFIMGTAILTKYILDFSILELSLYALVVIISLAGIFFLTEMHMQNVFDEHGNRK
jgi:uncharacterized membrane protein